MLATQAAKMETLVNTTRYNAAYRSVHIAFLVVTCSLIGLCVCGSGGQSDSGDNPSSAGSRTIIGKQIVSYMSETGTTDVPDGLSKTTIAAYVPTGSAYTMLAGSGTSDGHYSIPDVPAGNYLLQIGSSYFWTGATNIDTGSLAQGRPNPTLSATGERINFDVALSVPTQNPDIFELVDPNISSGFFYFLQQNAPPSNTYMQVFFWPNPLIDASLSDKAYLSHLSTTNSVIDSGQGIYSTRIQEEMTPALSSPLHKRSRQLAVDGQTGNLSQPPGSPTTRPAFNLAISERSAFCVKLTMKLYFRVARDPGCLED